LTEKIKIIRKDFVGNDSCYFCIPKHTLTTKIAYIIELENGEETQCGPCCAKKKFGKTAVANVPNLTRSANEYESKKTNNNSRGGNSTNNVNTNKELEYLLLRCKYLDDFSTFPRILYQPLIDIYNKNQFEIDTEDRKHIAGIMNKWKDTKLSYENLMACYQAKRILSIWISQETDDIKSVDVAKRFYNFLKKNCYLTEKQVIGLNKWIVYMKKIPKINDKWFFRPNSNSSPIGENHKEPFGSILV
jgi:hypothetical protein